MTPDPYADPQAAFNAMMTTGAGLRRSGTITVKKDGLDPGRPVTRAIWYAAAKNLLDSGRLDRDQQRKLKALRNELRRTKVKG